MKLRLFLPILALLLCAACAAEPPAGSEAADPSATSETAESPAASDSSADAGATWATLTAEEAKARLDSGDPVTLVDVRTEAEYEDGHIEGALLLPNEDIGTSEPYLLPDKDAEILVYCRTGRRSAEAAKKLTAMGYTNVSDFGGIVDWPYETVTGEFVVPEALRQPGVLEGFTSTDLDGNPVDSSIFADYPVTMVNVWGTFCGPCIEEMPALGRLAAEYAPQGVQIVGIVGDITLSDGVYNEELTQLARDIVAETGADYLHLMPSEDLAERKLSEIQAFPTTFFVDETGTEIGEAVYGAQSEETWRAILDGLLAEYGAAS